MHLGPVSILQNTDCIHLGYEDRAPTLRHHYEPHGASLRGSQIALRIVGECGHRFDLVFAFHKGVTFVWYESSPDCHHGDPAGPTRELWRD
jgi:hypothetical protein